MSEEYKAKTREMIKVMQAYVDGQEIELTTWKSWEKVALPKWDWQENEYRIATAPDSIDWSHVAPEWKYMARSSGGWPALFKEKPTLYDVSWESPTGQLYASCFASYKRGAVDWKDSLVVRPE